MQINCELRECKLPPRIKILNYADFRDESNWEFELAKLIKQIKKDSYVNDNKPNKIQGKHLLIMANR